VGDEYGAFVVIQRKTEVFGGKVISVSLCPIHGQACILTRGSAANSPPSGGVSCFCSTWGTTMLSAVGGSV